MVKRRYIVRLLVATLHVRMTGKQDGWRLHTVDPTSTSTQIFFFLNFKKCRDDSLVKKVWEQE